MLADRGFLDAVCRTVRTAGGVADLKDDVCGAAVDAGYDYAYLCEDGAVVAAAGINSVAEPSWDERPARVETASASGVPEPANGDRTGETLLPVTDGDTRYGTLALAGDSPTPDEPRREYLRAVGELVGFALAAREATRARETLAAEVESERRQFQQLHSVAARMVACEDEDDIHELAIDAAENILDFDICSIDVAEGGYLVPVARSTGMDAGDSERFEDDEGIAGETYQQNERIVVDDVAAESGVEPTNSDYLSVLSVPIEGIGVFQAASERRGAFSERDAELAELLMAHVGETLRRLWSDRALRESEQKYRTLIEQSHDAVTIRQDGAYRFVNRRATELFGRSEAALLESGPRDLVHPEDGDALLELGADGDGHGDADRDGQSTFEARIRRPDGGLRYCEFSATAITYRGRPAVLASIRDITERKQRERELERQNERLDEFASVVSHDLRSPLNVARGSLDLAAESGDAKHFERAEEALDRMEALVEDVLELARQGRAVDETEPVALAEVATRAWASVDAPDATVDVALDGERATADEGRLRELFENLFRNAVEHAGSDVAVTVSRLPDGFAVTDDGPGVPADARGDVFDRGFTSAEDGTGFGLAIVREIADAHDWSVELVSTGPDDEVRGARFEVTGVSLVE